MISTLKKIKKLSSFTVLRSSIALDVVKNYNNAELIVTQWQTGLVYVLDLKLNLFFLILISHLDYLFFSLEFATL